MKHNYRFLFSVLFILISSISNAAPKSVPAAPAVPLGFGAGIMIGSPSAITAKTYIDGRNSFDFGLSFFASEYTLIYSDYLYQFPGFIKHPSMNRIVGYMGFGGVLVFSNSTRASNNGLLGTSAGSMGIGLRIPFGISWAMRTVPLEFFGEIVPGLAILPSTSSIFEAGVGLRYFFR